MSLPTSDSAHFGNGPHESAQAHRIVGTDPQDQLSAAIRRALQRNWVEQEPSECCADRDVAMMDALVSFVEGRLSERTEHVRLHLIDCPRCRFIYGCLRDTRSPIPTTVLRAIRADKRPVIEPVPELIRQKLRSSGPVIFPTGELAQAAWEFGMLTELPTESSEQILELVAGRAWHQLRNILPLKEVVIVCFSRPVHCIGKRLAATMVQAGASDIHVVMADGYFSPQLWCDPRELRDRHVVILVDVVRSGGLLSRLSEVCKQGTPRDIIGVAVVDQSRWSAAYEPLYALWTETEDERCFLEGDLPDGVRFFDPVAARARSYEDLPREVADAKQAQHTVETHLCEIKPLLPFIEATGALKQDAWIGGVCYPWIVDLLCLLRHDEARAELAQRTVSCLRHLAARGDWCLIYPAERFSRAGVWADLIANALGWSIVKVGRRNGTHYRALTAAQRRQLAACPRAMIVDAAIRTGKTLESLVGVLKSGPCVLVNEVVAFYAFDGLFAEPREEIERRLGIEVRSLFRLPLGAPTEPVGRLCRHWLNETLSELEDSDSDADWIEVVRAYCRKKLETTRRPARKASREHFDIKVRRALREGELGVEARLQQTCESPRPCLVKNLDVSYALAEPRTRNVLHGFLNNSMPSEFIEWCALALATQKDYAWLDKDWLALHKRFLTNGASQRWQFLAYIGYGIRRHGSADLVARVRLAIDDFRRSEAQVSHPLFPDLYLEADDPIQSRCKTLLSILARP